MPAQKGRNRHPLTMLPRMMQLNPSRFFLSSVVKWKTGISNSARPCKLLLNLVCPVKFCLSQTFSVFHKHSQETPHGTSLTEGARVGEQRPLFVNAHKLGQFYVVIANRPTKHWYISPSLLTRRLSGKCESLLSDDILLFLPNNRSESFSSLSVLASQQTADASSKRGFNELWFFRFRIFST